MKSVQYSMHLQIMWLAPKYVVTTQKKVMHSYSAENALSKFEMHKLLHICLMHCAWLLLGTEAKLPV